METPLRRTVAVFILGAFNLLDRMQDITRQVIFATMPDPRRGKRFG